MKTPNNLVQAKGIINPNAKVHSNTGGKSNTAAVQLPQNLTPYDIFQRCIKRANNIVEFHKGKSGTEKEEHYDAYRAAIVLSISALDAFVRTLVIEMISETLIKSGKLSKELHNYLKDLLSYEDLVEASRKDGFFVLVREKITSDFQIKSFQGEKKITYYLELAGRKKIFYHVSKKANTHQDNLIEEIDNYSQRRNSIAHGGDYDINKTPYQEKPIDKLYAQNCITTVSLFAKHLNEICDPNEKNESSAKKGKK